MEVRLGKGVLALPGNMRNSNPKAATPPLEFPAVGSRTKILDPSNTGAKPKPGSFSGLVRCQRRLAGIQPAVSAWVGNIRDRGALSQPIAVAVAPQFSG